MVDILQSKVIGPHKLTWYLLTADPGDDMPRNEFPAGSGHHIANGSRLFENKTEIRYEYQNGNWVPIGQVDVKLVEKTITENNTYNPADDDGADGYSSVIVDVPNTYAAGDEGKVVDNGALVAQTARAESITENGTYDTTKNNSVTVDVSGVMFAATPAAFTLMSNIHNLDVEVPNGVTSIALYAFNGCTGLRTIKLPNTVTSIGLQAFNGCTNLTSITIPNGLTSISDNAFKGCTNLPSIEIPSSVTTISNGVFQNCTNLTSIVVHKAEGSLSGAPWGAPETTQVIWTS